MARCNLWPPAETCAVYQPMAELMTGQRQHSTHGFTIGPFLVLFLQSTCYWSPGQRVKAHVGQADLMAFVSPSPSPLVLIIFWSPYASYFDLEHGLQIPFGDNG